MKILSSNLERKIHTILENNNVKFDEEHTFPDLVASSGRNLRFDFCVYKDNGDIDYLIEAQGVQHYKPVRVFGGKKGFYRHRYNDMMKREYCIRHGLILLSVPYWDENKVTYSYIMKALGRA